MEAGYFYHKSIRIYYFDDTKNEFQFLAEKEIVADSSQQSSATVFEILNTGKKVGSR